VNEVDPTAKIILFGSRARGDNKASSDWDFFILTSRQVDADYRDYRDVSESEIQPLIEVAEQMIFLIEKKIF